MLCTAVQSFWHVVAAGPFSTTPRVQPARSQPGAPGEKARHADNARHAQARRMRRRASCRSALLDLAPSGPSGHPGQHAHHPLCPFLIVAPTLPRPHRLWTARRGTITGSGSISASLLAYLVRLPSHTVPDVTGARQCTTQFVHAPPIEQEISGLPCSESAPGPSSMTKFEHGARQSGRMSGAPSAHPTIRAISSTQSHRLRPSAGCGRGPRGGSANDLAPG